MTASQTGSLQLVARNDLLRLAEPFVITGHVFHHVPVTRVELHQDGVVGRGEAAGVYYRDDRPDDMLATIEALRGRIEAGLDREALRRLLPPGGARNALDCALWELEARRSGKTVWQLAGLDAVRPLLTTFTAGADTPEKMATRAASYAGARAIKLKLTGEPGLDGARVLAVRARLPAAWIGVDANQGYDVAGLARLLPVLVEAKVSLLEQPFPRGQEALLDQVERPIPVAADESILDLAELEARHARFDVVNIKLDKCGGLTEGLLMARRARALGRRVMVGNMVGSSLAMAPAFVLGQHCDIVDLDGAAFLDSDCKPGVRYDEGLIHCADEVWGS